MHLQAFCMFTTSSIIFHESLLHSQPWHVMSSPNVFVIILPFSLHFIYNASYYLICRCIQRPCSSYWCVPCIPSSPPPPSCNPVSSRTFEQPFCLQIQVISYIYPVVSILTVAHPYCSTTEKSRCGVMVTLLYHALALIHSVLLVQDVMVRHLPWIMYE